MGNSRSSQSAELHEMPHQVRKLHYAVVLNDLNTVRQLVSQGVNINFTWYSPPSGSVKDGSTPLINAVSLNYIELVEVSQSISVLHGEKL